jgi:hypothetical protein
MADSRGETDAPTSASKNSASKNSASKSAAAKRDAEEWKRAFRWIESELGGRIVRAERQARWRPAWDLDLERDGVLVPLYFRGERGEADHGVYALEHEMRVLQVLERNDIPVPRVHAFCDEPRGIVMDRSPGRANLATADHASQRDAVLDHYMELLARMHQIDVAEFEAVGLERPGSAREIGLADHERWERGYRRNKQRPDPAIEYLARWVRAHVPANRNALSFLCCDAGQFLFEGNRVTAILDLELACLGDPVADLAGMRGRDLSEPLGDLSRAFAHYEALTGTRVDPQVLDFHTVRFGLVTPFAVAHLVASPPPGLDLVQYQCWYVVWTRSCLEVIADGMGLLLGEPDLPSSETGFGDDASADDFDAYAADSQTRHATLSARRVELGDELDTRELEDLSSLLGVSFTSRGEADRVLEQRIERGDLPDEPSLVSYLYRRMRREEVLVAPLLRELSGVRIQSLGRSGARPDGTH